MSTHEIGSPGTSWKFKAGVFRGKSPKWAGIRSVAVLCRGAENTLILDTGYDLPGTTWRLLMAASVVILLILAVVLKGHPASDVSADGVAGIFTVYFFMWMAHQRAMKLDLGVAVSEVVVDERRSRIALLTRRDEKASWIVLSEFRGSFSEVSAAILGVIGPKCRTGEITERAWFLP